jgi:hypothetical protein
LRGAFVPSRSKGIKGVPEVEDGTQASVRRAIGSSADAAAVTPTMLGQRAFQGRRIDLDLKDADAPQRLAPRRRGR